MVKRVWRKYWVIDNIIYNSDVDIAIVSRNFGVSPLIEKMKLYELRYDIDMESVPISVEDFKSGNDFFIKEIIKTGIDITDRVLH